MTEPSIDPPEGIPDDVVDALSAMNDAQLRELVHYAQQLLREREPLTDAIEPREGEELVWAEDYGAYAIVVVDCPDKSGDDRGPFAYRVGWEPAHGDENGQYRWHYLGRVDEGSGGE